MSKKKEIKDEVKMEIERNGQIINPEMNTPESVQDLFMTHPTVSLRKLSIVSEATYSLLLKASKKPEPGKTYNPDAINFSEIANYFNRRNVLLNDLDWNAMSDMPSKKSSSVVKDMDQFQVGSKIYLRKFPTIPYEVIYKTDTHIVIMLEGSTEPQAWAHNTFLLNGPQFTPRAVKVSVSVNDVNDEDGEA